jgi:solute carrier family 25, member 38
LKGSIDLLKRSKFLNKQKLDGNESKMIRSFTIGIIARVIADVFTYPLSIVKTRIESDIYNYKSTFHAFRDMLKNEGLLTFYKGFYPTLIRDISYSGIHFTIYTEVKRLLVIENENENKMTNTTQYALCALSSSVFACFMTQPPDVVRSYMQLNPKECTSMYKTAKLIIAKRGVSGFYAGFLPRSIRRISISILSWTIYETLSIMKK